MTPVRIVVLAHPIGKGRPRFDSRSGRAFTPKRTREYEAMVTQCARVAMRGRLPEHGPVSITIQLYWKNRVHSDVDNCAKALLDGMQGVIFRDDKQVMELHVYGGYDKGAPRAEVTVEAWRESEGKAA